MSERVVVTGLGCVAPKIPNADVFWARMLHAESSLGAIKGFDISAYRTQIGGELDLDLEALSGMPLRAFSRPTRFALVAAQEALQQAGMADDPERLNHTGICLGTGLGGMYFAEESLVALLRDGPRGVSPMLVPYVDPNSMLNQIAIRWGMRGPQWSIATACSSSGHALGQALDAIRSGRCQAMLAGGAETTISKLFFAGFDRLRAMSSRNQEPELACRPFSGDRDGFVLSEGAAMLVLESEQHARARGANILAELQGYGAGGGAFNSVSPVPGGEDLVRAMRSALRDAGITADDIDLINPHGTGTRLNDDAEAGAMQQVLGKRLTHVHVTPTKQLTGHLLGAAAALESVHVVQSIAASMVTPIKYFDGGYPINIATEGPLPSRIRHAMNHSFGFGNNNAVLVFGEYQ